MRGYAATLSTLNSLSATALATRQHWGESDFPRDIAKVVEIAGRRSFWPNSCLRQALLLKYFLAKQGIACDLRIGVKNSPETSFGAHAWVERDGVVIIGGEHAQLLYAKLI